MNTSIAGVPTHNDINLKREVDTNLLWSHQHAIQKLIMKPISATINLVGSKDTHPELMDILEDGLK